jgi:hypothetical protein
MQMFEELLLVREASRPAVSNASPCLGDRYHHAFITRSPTATHREAGFRIPVLSGHNGDATNGECDKAENQNSKLPAEP